MGLVETIDTIARCGGGRDKALRRAARLRADDGRAARRARQPDRQARRECRRWSSASSSTRSVRSPGGPRALPAIARRRRGAVRALGVDLVFAPSVAEMYPVPLECRVEVGRLADHLCGVSPRALQGVATVVLKLFEIVQPDRAYFGEKDAQQLAVVRRLVSDFNVPTPSSACRRSANRMAWR